MKKVFIIFILFATTQYCKAQAYGLSTDDIMRVFSGDSLTIKKILNEHGFNRLSGNLWMYKTQPTELVNKYPKTNSKVDVLFYAGKSFIIASPPDDNISLFVITFDVKYLSYYLKYFGKMGFAGYGSKASLDLDTIPQYNYSSVKLSLKNLYRISNTLDFKIWEDRCQMSLMYLRE